MNILNTKSLECNKKFKINFTVKEELRKIILKMPGNMRPVACSRPRYPTVPSDPRMRIISGRFKVRSSRIWRKKNPV